jgi:hypothetical protein
MHQLNGKYVFNRKGRQMKFVKHLLFFMLLGFFIGWNLQAKTEQELKTEKSKLEESIGKLKEVRAEQVNDLIATIEKTHVPAEVKARVTIIKGTEASLTGMRAKITEINERLTKK